MRAFAVTLLMTVTAYGQTDHLLPEQSVDRLPTRIAFGSCANQDKPQPVLTTAVSKRPDVFVYLGDNIYGDTRVMSELRAKYTKLENRFEFKKLRETTTILSTWDDHDYGENDAGREYPMKSESREIFLDFWGVPETSPRRTRPGIYGAHRWIKGDRAFQIILLDTRTFRDRLLSNPDPLPEGSVYKNDYQPDDNAAKSMLGADQWTWLKNQLQKPADLRLIASSIQFCHEYNGWESWTNLPHEQQRMFDLIRETRANGVVFITGDVHWGEISVRRLFEAYPVYDVTASGITEDWETVEANRFRIGEHVVQDNHFGLISVDWDPDDPSVDLQILNVNGIPQITHSVRLSQLSFPRRPNGKP